MRRPLSPDEQTLGRGPHLGINGGNDNQVMNNRIVGNPVAGVVVSSLEDLAPKGSDLSAAWACPKGGPAKAGAAFQPEAAPAGISFREVRAPKPQPQLSEDLRTPPAAAPTVDLTSIDVPSANLLDKTAWGSQ